MKIENRAVVIGKDDFDKLLKVIFEKVKTTRGEEFRFNSRLYTSLINSTQIN